MTGPLLIKFLVFSHTKFYYCVARFLGKPSRCGGMHCALEVLSNNNSNLGVTNDIREGLHHPFNTTISLWSIDMKAHFGSQLSMVPTS